MAFMGYETPVEAPQMRIYNTDLMKMYIAGVKEQYDLSREDYKDFMKAYGDFYSPIASDTDRYNDATINAVSNFVSQMGPDLFRTPEGQAAITRLINSVPVGELNKIKQSAEIAKEYVKNRGELMAKGLWNPEYEKWRLGGRSLEDWNTSRDGMWTNYSPAAFQDLHSFTDDWFKHLEPQLDEEYTAAKNDGFDYYRTSEKDLRGVISGRLDDVIKDGGLGLFYYYQALLAAGGNDDLAKELLTLDIVARNSDYYREKKEADPYKLDKQRTANDIWAHRLKKDIDHYYWKLENPQLDPDSPLYNGGVKKGDKIYSSWFNMFFDDAAAKVGGDSLSITNGLIDKVSSIVGNKKQLNETDAKKVIDAMAVQVPQYMLGVVTGQTDTSGSVDLNASMLSNLYSVEQIAEKMKGSHIHNFENSVQTTKNNREALKKNLLNNGIVSSKMSFNGKAVVYENHNGEVRIMLPVTIIQKVKEGTVDSNNNPVNNVVKHMMYNIGIKGRYNNGVFEPSPGSSLVIGPLDLLMTQQYSSKSVYSDPTDVMIK